MLHCSTLSPSLELTGGGDPKVECKSKFPNPLQRVTTWSALEEKARGCFWTLFPGSGSGLVDIWVRNSEGPVIHGHEFASMELQITRLTVFCFVCLLWSKNFWKTLVIGVQKEEKLSSWLF